jgi:predicted RNA-binding protein YlqC (UPF0109 family)
VKQLLENIAKALVDIPEEVSVRVVEGEQVTVFELRAARSDLGKVIGKQGRTADSIRTILDAAGKKLHRRFRLEILE